MKKEIRFTIKVNKECTTKEFREWIEFVLGYSGLIQCENPLCDTEFYETDIDFIDII